MEGKGVKCKHCDKQYKLGNVNKMEKHLFKCLKCPKFIKRLFLTSQKVQVNKYSKYLEKATPVSFAIDDLAAKGGQLYFWPIFVLYMLKYKKKRPHRLVQKGGKSNYY